MQKTEEYYDESYFKAQQQVGIDNVGLINHFFEPHIQNSDSVLEFGCGGGYLLASINCAKRLGFDVNPSALESARQLGVETTDDLDSIEDESFDIVISNSALEHTPTPYEDLCRLRSKLKANGKLVIRVPHETLGWRYKPNDWNYHLYTWSPMAIGNLCNEAGFDVETVIIDKSKRPPFFKYLKHVPPLNKLLSRVYRLARLSIEEFGMKTIAIDGNCIVVAKKRANCD